MKTIRTNKICAEFDFKKIQQDFDIYKITTAEKYIAGGAYLLDKPLTTLKASSLVFEYGKSFYALFYKDAVTVSEIRHILLKEENGDTLSFELIQVDRVPEYLLLQLLLNSINNPTNELLSFNNLTGKLICYRNDWLNKDKENFIWGLDCLELRIDRDMCLNVVARRLSSITLRKKMKFQKKQFHEYPQYLFTDYNYTLKRAEQVEVNHKENFIMKPVDGERAGITYLNFENQEKFECTKLGVLYNILSILKEEYGEYVKIDLQRYEVNNCLEYRNSELSKFKDLVKETVLDKGIVLHDCIGDETSSLYLEKLKVRLEAAIPRAKISVGKRISKQKLNIKLIHNKVYYEEKSHDPYHDNRDGAAVQHITLEDFKLDMDVAIANIIKELVIKKDLVENKISIVDWKSYRYQDDWIFGIKKDTNYYFMTIHPDGTFEIELMERDFFNMTEYDKYMNYFGDNEETNHNYRGVVGVIRDMGGNVNLIRDTNQITMPEVIAIGDTLALAAMDVKFSGAYIKNTLEHMIQSEVLGDKYIDVIEEVKKQFADKTEYSKTEVMDKVSNRTIKKALTNFVFEDTGELLYLFLRNHEQRKKLFNGVLDINYIELDARQALYNVGTVGAGMQSYIERASVIRKVEAVDEGKLFFQDLLPLMGVEFVRYGMLTVMPFPFKYLREYIAMEDRL